MTLSRLILFTLTALAGVGALYFFAIEVASAGLALLGVIALCLLVYFLIRRRAS